MEKTTNPPEPEPQPARETFVDYLVKKAKDDGAFDQLPGAGKPIADLDEPYDELWWVKKLLEREDLKKLLREKPEP